MKHRTQSLLKDTLTSVAERYGINSNLMTRLEDASNPSYFVVFRDQPAILRFSSSERRTENIIAGEIDFMRYLARNGVRTPAIYSSLRGDDMVPISDETGTYTAVLFEKLPGYHPDFGRLNDDIIVQWGKSLGKMHKLALSYSPAVPDIRRPHWYDLDAFQFLEQLRKEIPDLHDRCSEIFAHIKAIPPDTRAYGLIHADAEPWNMLMHQNVPGWIDFDESCYFHFGFDLAVSLTYMVLVRTDDFLNPDNEAKNAEAQHIWDIFYSAYCQEHTLPEAHIEHMPDFLLFRVMQDFAYDRTVFDLDRLEDWQVYVLANRQKLIKSGESFLKINWFRASK